MPYSTIPWGYIWSQHILCLVRLFRRHLGFVYLLGLIPSEDKRAALLSTGQESWELHITSLDYNVGLFCVSGMGRMQLSKACPVMFYGSLGLPQ